MTHELLFSRAHFSLRGVKPFVTCCDCLLKFLQRIMSSVVDSRLKPRAMKISSVVHDSLRPPEEAAAC